MSVLVVGLSHKGAPLATLERVALSGDALDKLLHDVSRADDVAGALVLSTCNRVEIYAEVDKFHSAVAAICELLSRHSQVPSADLTPFLYVHYQDRAVQHLLAVACGLDSMVIGESQILGQLRHALHLARERGTLGRALSDLGSLALRAGKRAQSQTSIGAAGASLVSVGLQVATGHLDGNGAAGSDGASSPAPAGLAGKRVLVIGAGAMSGLVVASLARAGAAGLTVASRTVQRAQRLAASAQGRGTGMSDLVGEVAAADLVVTCTGASGHVITADMVADVMRQRSTGLVLLDLAMPRDVDPQVAELPGVIITDLQTLAADGHSAFDPGEQAIGEVRRIMADELASHMSVRRAAAVTPTVVALRAKAAKVVDAEVARLSGRLDQLDGVAMAEIAKSMQRVTDKLLHDPTVRIKELAGSPGADSYEDALRVLFDLDPAAVQAVAQADAKLAGLAAGNAGTAAAGYDRVGWGGRMSTAPLRLGTRRSPMAMVQAGLVARAITAQTGRDVELVGIESAGDRSPALITQIGGTGVFVSALRTGLLAGEVDVAVHSLKDLPTGAAAGIALAAVPPRDDPRDALVTRDGAKLADLRHGAIVGTGSPRRAAQLLLLRPDIHLVPVRGNAGTRLAKVENGDMDALVLGYAGLSRIGRLDAVAQVFEPDEMMPCAGQGALAVECNQAREGLVALLGAIDDPVSRAATTAERTLLGALQGGCAAPVGAYASGMDVLRLDGLVVAVDGGMALRGSASGPLAAAEELGRQVAADLLSRGAARCMPMSGTTGVGGQLTSGDDDK